MNTRCTRVRARQIACEFWATSGGRVEGRLFTVRAFNELEGRPLCLYGLNDPAAALAESWIVWVVDAAPLMLRSSWIIAVSKVDGSILYSGSAHDEG